MAIQVIYNLALGVLWLALDTAHSLGSFIIGYLIGTVILYLIYRRSKERFYVHVIWKSIILIAIFFREAVVENLYMLLYVFSPKGKFNPGIIAMDVEFNTEFELVLFANFVTMNPGTLTIEVAKSNKKIYIHVLDVSKEEQIINKLRKTYEIPIKEVTGLYD